MRIRYTNNNGNRIPRSSQFIHKYCTMIHPIDQLLFGLNSIIFRWQISRIVSSDLGNSSISNKQVNNKNNIIATSRVETPSQTASDSRRPTNHRFLRAPSLNNMCLVRYNACNNSNVRCMRSSILVGIHGIRGRFQLNAICPRSTTNDTWHRDGNFPMWHCMPSTAVHCNLHKIQYNVLGSSITYIHLLV